MCDGTFQLIVKCLEKKTVFSQPQQCAIRISLLNSAHKLSFLHLFSINTSRGFIMVLFSQIKSSSGSKSSLSGSSIPPIRSSTSIL